MHAGLQEFSSVFPWMLLARIFVAGRIVSPMKKPDETTRRAQWLRPAPLPFRLPAIIAPTNPSALMDNPERNNAHPSAMIADPMKNK
jgi:hypothetical protein